MDREELQGRIRTHRPGDAAFRRGSPVGEVPEQGYSPYQPFRPEPEDELVIPGGADPAEAGSGHRDHTPPGFDEPPPPPPAKPNVPPPAQEPPPASWRPAPAPLSAATPVPVPAPIPPVAPTPAPPPTFPSTPIPAPTPLPTTAEPPPPAPRWTPPEEPYDAYPPDEPYDNRYRPRDDDWDRRNPGLSPLAIGGFVLLGVLAIAVGAFVSGIFSGGVANGSPSPTPSASGISNSTPQGSSQPSVPASVPASPNASPGPPGTFPDGFTARTEPCVDQPASADGCASSGASVSGGTVWAWVGFKKGNSSDVLGINVFDASGSSVGDGSLALASIGCTDSCSGWARFKFGGLAPGNYTIRVNRNGQPAAEAPFTVTG